MSTTAFAAEPFVLRGMLWQMASAISTAVEASPTPTAIVARDGIMLRANASLHHLAGYSPGALDGQPVTVLMLPEVAAKHTEEWLARAFDFRDDEPHVRWGVVCCTYVVRADGGRSPVRVSVAEPPVHSAPDVAIAYLEPRDEGKTT